MSMEVAPRRSRRWPRVAWPIRSRVTGRAAASTRWSRTARSSASEAACRRVTHRAARPAKNSSAQSGEAMLSGTGSKVSVTDHGRDLGVARVARRPGGGGGQRGGGEQCGGVSVVVGRGRRGGGERYGGWHGGQDGRQRRRGGQGGSAASARTGRPGIWRGGAGRAVGQVVAAGHGVSFGSG